MQLGLNKLPWYGQVLLFAVIGGVGAFSYDYFYASEMRAEIKTKQAQLVKERQDIARGRAAERRLAEFKVELKELESRFDALKAVVPEQRDVADMLRRIQTLATQSSLVVKAFKPQAIAPAGQVIPVGEVGVVVGPGTEGLAGPPHKPSTQL